jgi:hypothetical protein
MPNVRIELVDNDTGSVIKSVPTGTDGLFIMRLKTTDVPSGKTFTLRVNIPLSEAAGMLCDKKEYYANGMCIIVLMRDLNFGPITCPASRCDYPFSGFTLSGCGRKVIGDANCDGVVDVNDLMELKKNYKKSIASGADPWADFNGDGKVDINDLAILKKNYKMIIYGSENLDKTDPNFCKP